jgi:hypothetical protein
VYRGRIHELGRKPGVYEANGSPVIQWDDGTFQTVGASELVFADSNLKESRFKDTIWNDAFKVESRVGDLPELPIWEYDWVRPTAKMRDRGSNLIESYGPRFFVYRINWHHLGEMRGDGVTPMPIYNCQPTPNGGPSFALDSTEVELDERGRVWKWFNDRASLRFTDVEDEARFHRAMGYCEQVRNPISTNYGWTLKEVLLAIVDGKVDMFDAGGAFDAFVGIRGPVTPESDRHYAYKFHDEELGRQVRQRVIAGFNDLVSKYLEEEVTDGQP